MYFQHSPEIWQEFPELVPGVLFVDGIDSDSAVGARIEAFNERAVERLAISSESELPEIQAWRRAFSRMGLKPTQYRCASESLLRRFRKEKALPSIHPLIDLCNSISLAFAVPVAAFDVSQITGHLEVRHAIGNEEYLSFSGDTEDPEAGEVIFVDDAGQVHARRWTHRQSGSSAVRDTTAAVLIVAEAMHASASTDVEELTAAVAHELTVIWSLTPRSAILSQSAPRFEF